MRPEREMAVPCPPGMRGGGYHLHGRLLREDFLEVGAQKTGLGRDEACQPEDVVNCIYFSK